MSQIIYHENEDGTITVYNAAFPGLEATRDTEEEALSALNEYYSSILDAVGRAQEEMNSK